MEAALAHLGNRSLRCPTFRHPWRSHALRGTRASCPSRSGIRVSTPLPTVFPHFAALHAGYLWRMMQLRFVSSIKCALVSAISSIIYLMLARIFFRLYSMRPAEQADLTRRPRSYSGGWPRRHTCELGTAGQYQSGKTIAVHGMQATGRRRRLPGRAYLCGQDQ